MHVIKIYIDNHIKWTQRLLTPQPSATFLTFQNKVFSKAPSILPFLSPGFMSEMETSLTSNIILDSIKKYSIVDGFLGSSELSCTCLKSLSSPKTFTKKYSSGLFSVSSVSFLLSRQHFYSRILPFWQHHHSSYALVESKLPNNPQNLIHYFTHRHHLGNFLNRNQIKTFILHGKRNQERTRRFDSNRVFRKA